MSRSAHLLGLVAAAAILGGVGGAAVAPAAAVPTTIGPGAFHDCFWSIGAINGGAMNIAYPDAGANYWAAGYVVPAGATLDLVGKFPHARFASVQSYDPLSAPVDALFDAQIAPDRGSVNPFRPGVSRTAAKRSFTIRLAEDSLGAAPDPDERANAAARNVLHAVPAAPTTTTRVVLWRVYVPDRGRDLRGGVALPQPRLTMPGGHVLTGQAACDALRPAGGGLTSIDPSALLVSKPQYDALRYPPGVPAYFPAKPDPVWRVQYNRAYLLALYTPGIVPAGVTKTGQSGFFPNLFNQYARAAVNRKLGKIVAFRGRMATTPATQRGEKKVRATQLRYESFCMNESVLTTRVMDCVYDEQIPLTRQRRYVVITSRSGDRPRNATKRCGVAWIRWSPAGDGGDDHDFGWMQVRNMLPAATFHHAVQDTRTPGDERSVLGDYLPTGRYYKDKRAFEKLGCPVR
jgi:hypothetical protein